MEDANNNHVGPQSEAALHTRVLVEWWHCALQPSETSHLTREAVHVTFVWHFGAVTEHKDPADTSCCFYVPQWENTENKTSVVLYGVGALVTLWLSGTIVGAVNNVPLVHLWKLSNLKYGPERQRSAAG